MPCWSWRDGIGDLLRRAEPDDWLPFASDADLGRWRDRVADQFAPGAAIRTVEIFANRARIPDHDFLALLEVDVMAERIFNRIPLTQLDHLYEQAVVRTTDLMVRYFNGCVTTDSR